MREYTLDDQQVEVIWDTVGSSAWEIYYILEKLFQYPLEDIADRMKREKVAMIADWVDYDDIDDRRNLLSKFKQQNLIDRRKLTGLRNLLGQAAKDNILYYDPAEGAYCVQGKSLEWGIKGYFDET